MTRCKYALFLSIMLLTPGCIKSAAINSLADALGDGGGSYAMDDDPEFVGEASAFGLKTIESLLVAKPDHPKLLVAATRGFTQYAYAYLQTEADYLEEDDYAAAKRLRYRAWRMFRRARDYGLRALENRTGLSSREIPQSADSLAELDDDDMAMLYWTAVSIAAVVAVNKDDATAATYLDLVAPLIERALQIDSRYQNGGLYDFLISWESGRPAAAGGSLDKADAAYARAVKLADGKRLAPMVAYAESVCVKRQDRVQFKALLTSVADFDSDKFLEFRLVNLIAQKRARWLLSQIDDLFL
ncbi:MAG: TRAP transporter TatT component family protein [Bradymonadia bacterium]